jgi:hypothetical protein
MNPDRRRVVDERPGWVTPAIIGALLLAGILAFAASGNRDRTATTPAPETTGRTERAPVPPAAPLPANPNATTPQATPDVPRPQLIGQTNWRPWLRRGFFLLSGGRHQSDSQFLIRLPPHVLQVVGFRSARFCTE